MNDVEILKKIKDETFSDIVDQDGNRIYTLPKEERQALENILKERQEDKERIKELEKEYERMKNVSKWLIERISAQIATPELFDKLVEENYIPKTKVREKIDNKFKEAKGLYKNGVQPQAQYTMKLLRDLEQELLEEGDEKNNE